MADNNSAGGPNNPSDRQPPRNLWEAIFQTLWSWTPRRRNIVLCGLGLLAIGYLFWSTIPEQKKADLLTVLWGGTSAPTDVDGQPSGASRGASGDFEITIKNPPENTRVEIIITTEKGETVFMKKDMEPGAIQGISLPPGDYKYMIRPSQPGYPFAGEISGNLSVKEGKSEMILLPKLDTRQVEPGLSPSPASPTPTPAESVSPTPSSTKPASPTLSPTKPVSPQPAPTKSANPKSPGR